MFPKRPVEVHAAAWLPQVNQTHKPFLDTRIVVMNFTSNPHSEFRPVAIAESTTPLAFIIHRETALDDTLFVAIL